MKFYGKSITLQPDLLMQTDLLLLFFVGRTKKRRAFKKQFTVSNFIKFYQIFDFLILFRHKDFVCFSYRRHITFLTCLKPVERK